MKVYQKIAQLLNAKNNSEKTGNAEWSARHTETIENLVRTALSSGSGLDDAPEIDFDKSTENKLVFNFGYHHMSDHGYYDGWTYHQLIVTASLCFDIDLRITGKDKNSIKEMLYEQFQCELTEELD